MPRHRNNRGNAGSNSRYVSSGSIQPPSPWNIIGSSNPDAAVAFPAATILPPAILSSIYEAAASTSSNQKLCADWTDATCICTISSSTSSTARCFCGFRQRPRPKRRQTRSRGSAAIPYERARLRVRCNSAAAGSLSDTVDFHDLRSSLYINSLSLSPRASIRSPRHAGCRQDNASPQSAVSVPVVVFDSVTDNAAAPRNNDTEHSGEFATEDDEEATVVIGDEDAAEAVETVEQSIGSPQMTAPPTAAPQPHSGRTRHRAGNGHGQGRDRAASAAEELATWYRNVPFYNVPPAYVIPTQPSRSSSGRVAGANYIHPSPVPHSTPPVYSAHTAPGVTSHVLTSYQDLAQNYNAALQYFGAAMSNLESIADQMGIFGISASAQSGLHAPYATVNAAAPGFLNAAAVAVNFLESRTLGQGTAPPGSASRTSASQPRYHPYEVHQREVPVFANHPAAAAAAHRHMSTSTVAGELHHHRTGNGSATAGRGLSKEDIRKRTVNYRYKHQPDNARSAEDQTQCIVCMCDFENRQLIRVIACRHRFHAKCVDKWLKSNRSCPLCRSDAISAAPVPQPNPSGSGLLTVAQQRPVLSFDNNRAAAPSMLASTGHSEVPLPGSIVPSAASQRPNSPEDWDCKATPAGPADPTL